ncbi:hypothetical protein BGX27_002830 [Mortierella sp. AM989]|nr:hypothetical protein BGX27_002830 [Mortierella sp. AM989]
MKAGVVRPLSDIFRGVKGIRGLLDRQVRLQLQEVFREKFQCLHNQDDVLPFANDILCEDEIRHGREDGLFLCKKNNANLICRWIMKSGDGGKPLAIFVQAEHAELTTDGDKFSHKKLRGWYDKIHHSTSSFIGTYEVVIVLITNMKYTNPAAIQGRYHDDQYGSDGISDMPELLLIDKSNIKEYLSPTFAYRGILATPDNFQSEQIQSLP